MARVENENFLCRSSRLLLLLLLLISQHTTETDHERMSTHCEGWREKEKNLFDFTTLDSIFMALSAPRTMVSDFIRFIRSLSEASLFYDFLYFWLLLMVPGKKRRAVESMRVAVEEP